MFLYLIKGILLGITVAFLIGPVFFTIIQTSIYRGFRSGIFLSLGVLLSDLSLIVLSYIGVLGLLGKESNQLLIGIIGGILLIIFGMITLTRKPSLKEKDTKGLFNINSPGPLTYILKGYFMNIMNPFLLIFWISVMSVFSANKDIEKINIKRGKESLKWLKKLKKKRIIINCINWGRKTLKLSRILFKT